MSTLNLSLNSKFDFFGIQKDKDNGVNPCDSEEISLPTAREIFQIDEDTDRHDTFSSLNDEKNDISFIPKSMLKIRF